MAKTATARKGSSVRSQARRVLPSLRRAVRRVKSSQAVAAAPPPPQPHTLGELIAAAFDTAGGEMREVLKLVGSQQFAKAVGRRIVLVP
jgi:hypothetical protein